MIIYYGLVFWPNSAVKQRDLILLKVHLSYDYQLMVA